MEPTPETSVCFAGRLGLLAKSEGSFIGSTGDKIKGAADQAMGAIKQGVGKMTGADRMKVEGKIQELKGQAEVAVGKTKDAIKKGTTAAADAINKKL